MGASLPNIVIVTTPTRMQGLVAQWGTKGAARFRLKQAIAHRAQRAELAEAVTLAEADFDLYETENTRYLRTIEQLRDGLEEGFPVTILQRQYLANYDFRNAVVVIVVGPDGLVANTAKYVGDLPIVGVNPDPARNDGVLLPFHAEQAPRAVKAVLDQRAATRSVTMAEAVLSDGQRLLAFNDFFVGRRSHVSARYNLRWRGHGGTAIVERRAGGHRSGFHRLALECVQHDARREQVDRRRSRPAHAARVAGSPPRLGRARTVCQPAFVRNHRGRHGRGR